MSAHRCFESYSSVQQVGIPGKWFLVGAIQIGSKYWATPTQHISIYIYIYIDICLIHMCYTYAHICVCTYLCHIYIYIISIHMYNTDLYTFTCMERQLPVLGLPLARRRTRRAGSPSTTRRRTRRRSSAATCGGSARLARAAVGGGQQGWKLRGASHNDRASLLVGSHLRAIFFGQHLWGVRVPFLEGLNGFSGCLASNNGTLIA